MASGTRVGRIYWLSLVTGSYGALLYSYLGSHHFMFRQKTWKEGMDHDWHIEKITVFETQSSFSLNTYCMPATMDAAKTLFAISSTLALKRVHIQDHRASFYGYSISIKGKGDEHSERVESTVIVQNTRVGMNDDCHHIWACAILRY